MYGGFGQIGRTGILRSPAATNQALSALICRRETVFPKFVLHWLNTYRFLWKEFAGSSRKDPNITKNDVAAFPIALPPLPEQQKIADILSTWDEALKKLDALIATKDRRKQALMQRLLAGKRAKKWPRVPLSEVAVACSIRNGEKLDRTRLYAVTKAEGMVPMRDNVQGATINRCQIVERGWFAYNPMRINIGSIARWEHDAPVMVSPDYVVFKTDENRLLSDYLNHVRRSIAWSDFVGAAGNGSVRVRIWFDDLGCFKFPLPSLPEQRAIADVLDAADAELRLLRQQRAALDRQKRGLMQQLLTGRIRVQTST
jgi:type I restriction enzyme S subunit